MIKILSKRYCYDNNVNRIKIIAKLSDKSTLILFKTPIKGGPYSYFYYVLDSNMNFIYDIKYISIAQKLLY